jgi:predicted nuclease of predicted toxin-antitoxin system
LLAVRGFLLDAHVPADVARAVRDLVPNCAIDHLATWNGGLLLDAPDEQILSAALAHNLALVTYDVSTIPAILHDWIGSGRHLPHVVLVASGIRS